MLLRKERGWEAPHADFKLYKEKAYKQSDGVLRDIYYKDCPAGQLSLILKKGSAAILGFRKSSDIKEPR
jgi:hypothetical protein